MKINVVELNPYGEIPYVFTELAKSLCDLIESAGHSATHRLNDLDPLATSIVLGAHPSNLRLIDKLDPQRTLIANFEQLESDSHLATEEYKKWLQRWVVVDYHSKNVEHLQQRGHQRVFELPIIPGSSLVVEPRATHKTIDVLFYGTRCKRRDDVLEKLTAAGFNVKLISGAYGANLSEVIQSSRIVLHIHHYATALFPVARFLQPIVRLVPIVCENSVFSSMSDWSHSGIMFTAYESIVDACKELLTNPLEQVKRVHRTQAFYQELNFKAPFNRALEAL